MIKLLWLIPVLPLTAAAITALLKQRQRRPAAFLAIGAMGLACLLSGAALASTLGARESLHEVVNFRWLDMGNTVVRLGWVLDPLAAVMLVMVSFVGLLIFIYSDGYMAEDPNFTRFFVSCRCLRRRCWDWCWPTVFCSCLSAGSWWG